MEHSILLSSVAYKFLAVDRTVTLGSTRYQGLLPPWQSDWGAKLTTHLHLVPRSWMHGAIPPLANTFSQCGA